MNVKVILEEGAVMPEFQSEGAAAVDLCALIDAPITIRPGEKVFVSTGVKLDMTEAPNLCAEAMPRSGLGSKGLVLANTVGLIDNDYQGPIGLTLWNSNAASVKTGMGYINGESIVITPGMRVAQLRFTEFVRPEFAAVKKFAKATKRGGDGFGSTGE